MGISVFLHLWHLQLCKHICYNNCRISYKKWEKIKHNPHTHKYSDHFLHAKLYIAIKWMYITATHFKTYILRLRFSPDRLFCCCLATIAYGLLEIGIFFSTHLWWSSRISDIGTYEILERVIHLKTKRTYLAFSALDFSASFLAVSITRITSISRTKFTWIQNISDN